MLHFKQHPQLGYFTAYSDVNSSSSKSHKFINSTKFLIWPMAQTRLGGQASPVTGNRLQPEPKLPRRHTSPSMIQYLPMKSRPLGLEVAKEQTGGFAPLPLFRPTGQARKGAAQPETTGAQRVAGLRRVLGQSCLVACAHLVACLCRLKNGSEAGNCEFISKGRHAYSA